MLLSCTLTAFAAASPRAQPLLRGLLRGTPLASPSERNGEDAVVGPPVVGLVVKVVAEEIDWHAPLERDLKGGKRHGEPKAELPLELVLDTWRASEERAVAYVPSTRTSRALPAKGVEAEMRRVTSRLLTALSPRDGLFLTCTSRALTSSWCAYQSL